MIETTKGLPNTCSCCGQPPGSSWYAENVDQARAGQGVCASCLTPPSPPSSSRELEEALGSHVYSLLGQPDTQELRRLQRLPDEEILRIPGIGRKRLRELREVLDDLHL